MKTIDNKNCKVRLSPTLYATVLPHLYQKRIDGIIQEGDIDIFVKDEIPNNLITITDNYIKPNICDSTKGKFMLYTSPIWFYNFQTNKFQYDHDCWKEQYR
jgi:hypothetical protein